MARLMPELAGPYDRAPKSFLRALIAALSQSV